jgi:uncharacterized protein YgiM (DUF1202 family)/beta-N-acetylglucosaminidase
MEMTLKMNRMMTRMKEKKIRRIKRISSFLIITFLVLSFLPTVSNAASYSATVTATKLSHRKTASTSGFLIQYIPKNTVLTVQDYNSKWVKATYQNKAGYLSKTYISKVSSTSISSGSTVKQNVLTGTSGMVTLTSNLNVRSGPGTNYSKIGSLKNKAAINVTGQIGSWHQILYNGKIGYISKDYTTAVKTQSQVTPVPVTPAPVTPAPVTPVPVTPAPVTPAPATPKSYQVKITATSLNLRQAANTTSKILTSITYNNVITVTDHNSEWLKTTYNGKTGYIYKIYTGVVNPVTSTNPTPTLTPAPADPEPTPITTPKPTPADYWVQVKSGASTWKSTSETGNVVIRVSVGDLLKVTPIDSNWVKIKRNGEESYLKISNVQPIDLPYLNLNFRTHSSVTADEINRYIQIYETRMGKVGALHNQGQNIIDIANRSGVNAVLLAAMAILESGYGTSGLAMSKFNVFSQAAFDRQPYDYAYRFESVQHAIEFQAEKLKRDYLTPGGKYFNGAFLGDKSGGMNVKYATDEVWGAKIADYANKIHAYKDTEYAGVSLSTIQVDSSKISFPDYVDDFSNFNIIATVLNSQNVILSATRDTSTIVKTLSAGTTFRILCKYNDNDMKVLYDNKEYYFYGYSDKPKFVINNLVRKDVSYSQTQFIYYEQDLSASTVGQMVLKDTAGNNYTVADNSDFVKPFRK